MRANQKYFACTGKDGALAPAFVCVANIDAKDGGEAIVEGNRRVLAARLADARFFWEQDLKVPLEEQAKKLDGIVFHEKLGTLPTRSSGSRSWRGGWRKRGSWGIVLLRRQEPRLDPCLRRGTRRNEPTLPSAPRGWRRPTSSPGWSASFPSCRGNRRLSSRSAGRAGGGRRRDPRPLQAGGAGG
jgi:hypothetical protein